LIDGLWDKIRGLNKGMFAIKFCLYFGEWESSTWG